MNVLLLAVKATRNYTNFVHFTSTELLKEVALYGTSTVSVIKQFKSCWTLHFKFQGHSTKRFLI